jgi:outer membrane protein OmpA-like peptidoglycan-associated protein
MRKVLLSILIFLSFTPVYAQRAHDTFKLYFDIGIAALNSATSKKIDLLIYNDKIITGSSIMIIGYADYLGTEGRNKTLSMNRAKNVKAYLVKYGLNADDIKMCLGKGEVERAGMTGRDGFPTDRRVDIVVNNRVKHYDPPEKTASGRKPKYDTLKKVTNNNFEDFKHMTAGSTFLLNNVYFPPDRHTIKPESKETLEKLYTVLRDYPYLKISIEGHVCCVRDAKDAMDIETYEVSLSVNRAKAIYYYLINRGIDSSRLKYIGYGRSRPVIYDEQSEADAEKNRRVELRITENRRTP